MKETSQPRVIRAKSENLPFALRSWTGIMLETLHKEIRNFHFYDVLDSNVF